MKRSFWQNQLILLRDWILLPMVLLRGAKLAGLTRQGPTKYGLFFCYGPIYDSVDCEFKVIELPLAFSKLIHVKKGLKLSQVTLKPFLG